MYRINFLCVLNIFKEQKMKHNIYFKILILGFTFNSITSFGAICGKVQKLKGDVEILRVKPGQSGLRNPVRNILKAKKKIKIGCNDVLQTTPRSRVKVRFINNAVMSMGPSSRISIKEYSLKSKDVSLINLTYGKVRTFLETQKIERDNQNLKTRLKIKTPGATVGVRGTDFYLSYDPNKKMTEQATLKGSVEVEQLGSGQKVIVSKGEQVNVEKVIESPVDFEPDVDPRKNRMLRAGESLPIKKVRPPVKPIKLKPKAFKPLVVKKIEPTVVKDIKETSSIAKEEQVFASTEALAILGTPESWKAPKEEKQLLTQLDQDKIEDKKSLKTEGSSDDNANSSKEFDQAATRWVFGPIVGSAMVAHKNQILNGDFEVDEGLRAQVNFLWRNYSIMASISTFDAFLDERDFSSMSMDSVGSDIKVTMADIGTRFSKHQKDWSFFWRAGIGFIEHEIFPPYPGGGMNQKHYSMEYDTIMLSAGVDKEFTFSGYKNFGIYMSAEIQLYKKVSATSSSDFIHESSFPISLEGFVDGFSLTNTSLFIGPMLKF